MNEFQKIKGIRLKMLIKEEVREEKKDLMAISIQTSGWKTYTLLMRVKLCSPDVKECG